MTFQPNSHVMLTLRGRILSGRVKMPFSKPVCEKILRPYFANKYGLSLEDSLQLVIKKVG